MSTPERLGRPIGITVWVMAAAAIVSLLLVPWVGLLAQAEAGRLQILLGVDLALCVLFAFRFLGRIPGYAGDARSWGAAAYELVAIVPLLTPWAGDHALPLVAIGLARAIRAVTTADDLIADAVTIFFATRLATPVIDMIKRPITVAVLDEVIDVIESGTYAANVRAALDENHRELEAMVLDLVRKDPATGKLRYLPFHDDILNLIADTVLRIVDGALEDPRTTELISDVIRHSAAQLRQAVRDKS